jgi:hypothetical protein
MRDMVGVIAHDLGRDAEDHFQNARALEKESICAHIGVSASMSSTGVGVPNLADVAETELPPARG